MRVKTRTPKKRIEQTEKGDLSVGTGNVGKEEVTRNPRGMGRRDFQE